MIDDLITVFQAAGNKRFGESKVAWIRFFRGLSDEKLDILASLLNNIDVQRISLAQLSGLLQMAALDRTPNFERYGLDSKDPRLYADNW